METEASSSQIRGKDDNVLDFVFDNHGHLSIEQRPARPAKHKRKVSFMDVPEIIRHDSGNTIGGGTEDAGHGELIPSAETESAAGMPEDIDGLIAMQRAARRSRRRQRESITSYLHSSLDFFSGSMNVVNVQSSRDCKVYSAMTSHSSHTRSSSGASYWKVISPKKKSPSPPGQPLAAGSDLVPDTHAVESSEPDDTEVSTSAETDYTSSDLDDDGGVSDLDGEPSLDPSVGSYPGNYNVLGETFAQLESEVLHNGRPRSRAGRYTSSGASETEDELGSDADAWSGFDSVEWGALDIGEPKDHRSERHEWADPDQETRSDSGRNWRDTGQGASDAPEGSRTLVQYDEEFLSDVRAAAIEEQPHIPFPGCACHTRDVAEIIQQA